MSCTCKCSCHEVKVEKKRLDQVLMDAYDKSLGDVPRWSPEAKIAVKAEANAAVDFVRDEKLPKKFEHHIGESEKYSHYVNGRNDVLTEILKRLEEERV